VVHEVRASIERRDWVELEILLHPYLRWTDRDGRTAHGRRKVLAKLAAEPSSGPPTSYQLRDGQIYRWSEAAG
jgi:hypothetical protein